jgi:hypothetical protein|tara:strand:+ start:5055 stop:5252 length:198 start_codon:yes stop_codon:yes gene_type:complete
MAENLDILSDKEIKLECLRLAVEFAGEYQRSKPLDMAQTYYDWVIKKNSKRKLCECKTSKKKDQV